MRPPYSRLCPSVCVCVCVTFLIWRRMTDSSVTKVDSSMQRAASLANARDLDGEAWLRVLIDEKG